MNGSFRKGGWVYRYSLINKIGFTEHHGVNIEFNKV